jgi:hypothetical protein
LVGAVGIEITALLETKEFCGAPWPSKELKRKDGNRNKSLVPPNCP